MVTFRAWPLVAYCASKVGVMALTKAVISLVISGAARDIRGAAVPVMGMFNVFGDRGAGAGMNFYKLNHLRN
jgi:hypothetical protein